MSKNLDPGQRLSVAAKNGAALGLGTFLWDDEILLDKGTKISAKHCNWERAAPSRVPQFEIELGVEARVFEGEGHLHNTGYWLPRGERTIIEEVALRGWNHGEYVAGRFHYRGSQYWLIMSEIVIAWEPHLHLVD